MNWSAFAIVFVAVGIAFNEITLNKLRTKDYDIILSDIKMSGMNAFEYVRNFKGQIQS